MLSRKEVFKENLESGAYSADKYKEALEVYSHAITIGDDEVRDAYLASKINSIKKEVFMALAFEALQNSVIEAKSDESEVVRLAKVFKMYQKEVPHLSEKMLAKLINLNVPLEYVIFAKNEDFSLPLQKLWATLQARETRVGQ